MSSDAPSPFAPIALKHSFLGSTGLKVSELCLGSMTFGFSEHNSWGLPTAVEDESFSMLDRFYEVGGNFIDTADVYGLGDSERVVGRWLNSKSRDSVVIATKVGGPMGPAPLSSGLSRRHICSSIDGSLDRLKTGYVDLYQAHMRDPDTPIEETMRTFNDLVRCGKVRYIGLSNFASWHIAKAQECARAMGLEPVVSLQPQYSLLSRHIEWDILPLCESEGLAVLPWSPLAGGWLSGRYTRDTVSPPEGSRVAWAEGVKWKATDWSTMATEHTWTVIDTLLDIAKKVHRTPAQVALRWVMQRPGVTAPIIGAKNMTQLQDNLACAGFVLSAEDVQALNDASAVDIPYPWGAAWNRKPAPRKW